MNLPFKSVEVRSFVHATEDLDKVKDVIKSIVPEDVEMSDSKAKGHHGDEITLLTTRINRNPYIREFWGRVMKMMPSGERAKLKEIAIDRIAEDCRLYLRFDKQKAVNGKLILIESGDAIHVRINITAYPAKRKIAVKEMQDFISSGLNNGD